MELQYYFHRECLSFLQSDTSLSAEWYFAVHGFVLTKLTSLFFEERLYCIQIWCTSFALVATYVHYTLCSLFKPSSAGDSKTTVGTVHTQLSYIRMLHYCTPFARCLWQSTATYTTATMIPSFQLLQVDYPLTILGIHYDFMDAFYNCDCTATLLQIHGTPFDDSADTLWRFRGHP